MAHGLATLKVLIWILICIINLVNLPMKLLKVFKRKKTCPPTTNHLLLLPVSELTRRIRYRELNVKTVINAYIERIKKVNPFLNAVIDENFKEALEEANRIDEFLLNNPQITPRELEEKYPLLGVPITVKGSISLKGLRNTSGMLTRDNIAKCELDAIPVERAKEAGAIPLVTTNVPELCMNWETRNKLIGTTNNPYDLNKTVGGSSGGEAALLASCGSLIGIGSDIAGSLRLPAHYCGVYGHKPSPGVVSNQGHYPSCKHQDVWRNIFALGPMARYATDLKLLLNNIAEPEYKTQLDLLKPVNIRTLKIYMMKDVSNLIINKPGEDVEAALNKIVEYFGEEECFDLDLPLMREAGYLAAVLLLDVDDIDNIFKGRGKGSGKELFKYFIGQSRHDFMPIAYGVLRKLHKLLPKSALKFAKEKMHELKNTLVDLLKNDGVLILSAFPVPAYSHGEILTRLFDPTPLSTFNYLGLPVTACPIMMSKEGLPIGVQIVAAPNCDRLSLAVAEELERAFGGWKPVPSQ